MHSRGVFLLGQTMWFDEKTGFVYVLGDEVKDKQRRGMEDMNMPLSNEKEMAEVWVCYQMSLMFEESQLFLFSRQ